LSLVKRPRQFAKQKRKIEFAKKNKQKNSLPASPAEHTAATDVAWRSKSALPRIELTLHAPSCFALRYAPSCFALG